MARDYGKIFTAAWGDPAFRALTVPAQHLYMQLVSQPDTTMAGVLTTAPPRWAGQSAGSTVARVQEALSELEAGRFVVTDPETMETLIRSFVRRDLGWRSPRTMIAVDSSIRAILSPMLRGVLAEDLRRCDTTDLSDQVSDKTGQSTRAVVEKLLQGIIRDCTIPPADQAEQSCVDTVSDTLSDGVRSGSLTTTATANANAPANATANAPERGRAPGGELLLSPEQPRKRGGAMVYPDAFEVLWGVWPKSGDTKRTAFTAWEKATRGTSKLGPRISEQDLLDAVERFAADPNLPGPDEHRYIPALSVWINQDRWENGPLPPRGGRQSNVSQSLDVVAQLRAERDQRQHLAPPAPPRQITNRRTA